LARRVLAHIGAPPSKLEKCSQLAYINAMRRDDIIAKLKAAEPVLRARGVRRAAVFGSIARGDDRPNSDIDILVEFEPGSEGSIYDYMNLKEYIAGLFDGPVDVIDRDALKPHLRAPAARDTVYAF
jgi:predicted nucleotidyltransferase